MAVNFNSFVYDTAVDGDENATTSKTAITIAIYFDGTLNNKWNTEARYIYEAWYRNTPETDAKASKL